ncbi:MAG: hypothetical protein IKA02_05295 [Clostridia bacterium]|nr:hypothetical protein [Clostridia bacterium]
MKKLPLILIFALLIAISLTVVAGATSIDDNTVTVIVVSVIAMFLTGGIFAIVVVVSYKKKLRGTIYPFDKFTNLELTDFYDKYSHSHTTRYKYKDSSNRK